MKTIFTYLSCLLITMVGFSQTDTATNGTAFQVPERTAELQQLYDQAKTLETTGTAAEINANRLAIKAEWQKINPEIAALYKPVANNGTFIGIGDGTPYVPSVIKKRPEITPTRDWGDDNLIREGFIDGVDMVVTLDGDIYIGVYENEIDFGGSEDHIYIYKSTDDGASFNLWKDEPVTVPIRGMQLISIDGNGDGYLIAYTLFDDEAFIALRWDFATATLDVSLVATDVKDFSIDRNYPSDTSQQRVFATYLKDDGGGELVYSARSTAGSYGFDWVDETNVDNVFGAQIDFAYGLNGATYTTYTGGSSGNLYVNVNNDYNDPASWTPRETLEDGSNQETLNPSIAAARKGLTEDKVIIWASDRATGSSDNFNGVGYLRENEGTFSIFSNFDSGGADWNIAHTDAWVRKGNGVETIRTSYVRDRIDDMENDTNRSLTFNGTDFDAFEAVGDSDIDVWDGFASATAETNDEKPCFAFAGTSSDGLYGENLYFDAKREILSTQDIEFDHLSVYPVPVKENLYIDAINPIDTVRIFSILGKKVLETDPSLAKIQINTASLKKGVYLMQIEFDGKIKTQKIIKQ